MSMEQERAEFEKWVRDNDLWSAMNSDAGGQEWAWDGWRAGREFQREEDAKRLEQILGSVWYDEVAVKVRELVDELAAIRAGASSTGEPTEQARATGFGIGHMTTHKFLLSHVTPSSHVGYCLSCKKQLSVCGKPFTAELRCRLCGRVNVYLESQQPISLAA